jgi:adenylate kinase
LLKRAEAEGRADDTEETIRNRMRVYRQQTQPLVAHYRAAGILVEVDGIGSLETVAERVQEALA